MAKDIKKGSSIKITVEDAERLFTECYAEIKDTHAKAQSLFIRIRETMITDPSDMAALGKTMTDMLRLKLEASKAGMVIAKNILEFKKSTPFTGDMNEEMPLDEETIKRLEKLSKNKNP